MRRGFQTVLGALVGLLVLASLASPQPFPANIQVAINQLVTGVTPFTALRNVASAYMNWGATGGINGYGLRDNAGVIEYKNSAGAWTPISSGSGAPATASFLTRVAEAGLTNETALGALSTGLLINTTTTGIPTIYAGVTCTNQFLRVLSAIGAGTCATVDLLTDTTSTLTVSRGGTGLTTGTSGGILAFTAAGTITSSGALTANRIVLGGGAGAAPTILGSLGTTTTLLHGNAAGAPTFGAASLTADVSGILPSANGGTNNAFFALSGPATSTKTYTLPNANTTLLTTNAAVTAAQGGTGQTTYAVGDLLQATAATTLSKLAAVSTGNALISGGVTTASAWGKIGLTTHVTGTLPVANGGTGLASYSVGDLIFASATTTLASRAAVAVGQVLISQGVTTAPVWSANPRVGTLLLGADLAFSSAAPTISSGFGTGASVTAGTSAAFTINVGTGGTATNGVVGLPTATTGWVCSVEDRTAVLGNVGDQRTVQIASSTTTATFESQVISTGAATAWVASDILAASCIAF